MSLDCFDFGLYLPSSSVWVPPRVDRLFFELDFTAAGLLQDKNGEQLGAATCVSSVQT